MKITQSFFEFNISLYGYDVYSKETNLKIPRYQLYWAGYTLEKIKQRFYLKLRMR